MKSLNNEILALSKLVEEGRLSKEDFVDLRDGLIKESGVGLYSAESPLPPSRIPMEPAKIDGYCYYNTRKAEPVKEKKERTWRFSIPGIIFGIGYYYCMAAAIGLMIFIAPDFFKLAGIVISKLLH